MIRHFHTVSSLAAWMCNCVQMSFFNFSHSILKAATKNKIQNIYPVSFLSFSMYMTFVNLELLCYLYIRGLGN